MKNKLLDLKSIQVVEYDKKIILFALAENGKIYIGKYASKYAEGEIKWEKANNPANL